MKRLTYILPLFILAGVLGLTFTYRHYHHAPKHHTFTFIQKKSNDACGTATTSCVISGLTAVGTGHLLVGVAWMTNATGTAATGASGAGTWVHSTSPSCSGNNGVFGTDQVYILSTTSAAPTSITVFITGSATAWHAEVREYSFTGTSTQFDTCGGASDTTCTSCNGVGLTLSGANDVIVQSENPAVTCSAISGGYGNLNTDGSGGVCSADLLNTIVGTAPVWTTGSGTSMVSGMAIKEISSSSCPHLLATLGVTC